MMMKAIYLSEEYYSISIYAMFAAIK